MSKETEKYQESPAKASRRIGALMDFGAGLINAEELAAILLEISREDPQPKDEKNND